MTMNIMCVKGSVKFFFHDTKPDSSKNKKIITKTLSESSYKTITIPPKIWFAFKGLEKHSVILNISNIVHDDNERLKRPLNYYNYNF